MACFRCLPCRSRLTRKYPSIRDAFRSYQHVPGGDDAPTRSGKKLPATTTSDFDASYGGVDGTVSYGQPAMRMPVAGSATRAYAASPAGGYGSSGGGIYGSLRSLKSASERDADAGLSRKGIEDDRSPYATVRSIHEGLLR